jgi:predicted transcriptional regulator
MKLQYKYQRHRPHRQQRTSIDIIAIILELVLDGVGNKYQIMNRASLEYNQLSSYLQMMIENDLLHMNGTKERLNGDNLFNTTAKGFRFLQLYRQLNLQLTT